MCGRYTLTKFGGTIRKAFRVKGEVEAFKPRFNIAPSQAAPVIVSEHRLAWMQWGLVPSWAKDPAIGNRMINARSETVAEKPAFKGPLQRRRCLVLADGFYEWKRDGRARLPFYFRLHGHQPFAFAGLWDEWSSPEGSPLQTFTILTTQANPVVEPVHHRMPVILNAEQGGQWLKAETIAPGALAGLLPPLPAEALEAYPVDPMVNSPKHDRPECVVPKESPDPPPDAQTTLF